MNRNILNKVPNNSLGLRWKHQESKSTINRHKNFISVVLNSKDCYSDDERSENEESFNLSHVLNEVGNDFDNILNSSKEIN